MKDKAAVINVDGFYLYRKQQQLNCQLPFCDLPLSDHESVPLIPRVMPGLLYGCEVVLCSNVQLL